MEIHFNTKSIINRKATMEMAKQVLFDSMLKMHELATINAPFDVGILKTSIKLFPSTPGSKEYVLADGVEYGIDLEFGTHPHYVSANHLKDWARRKLGDENAAYAVAKKISQKGTEAKPFFRPALKQVQQIWIPRLWAKALR